VVWCRERQISCMIMWSRRLLAQRPSLPRPTYHPAALACRLRVCTSASPPQRLESWIENHGGQVVGVELRQCFDSSHPLSLRILTATHDIAEGACVITVPRACQLRYDNETHPGLLRLFERLPTGSDTGTGAWQFKQALTVRAKTLISDEHARCLQCMLTSACHKVGASAIEAAAQQR
jgi:hypothetical protein